MSPKSNGNVLIFAVTMLVAGTGLCRAGDITYQVAQGPIGIDGATITGTVETDGAIGTLAASDFLNFNLVVADGLGNSFDLTNANSLVTLNGSATTATANALQFNFASPNFGADGDLEILDSSSGWGWALAFPPGTELQAAVLPSTLPSSCCDAGLAALNPQPITLGTAITPLSLEGGSTSAPVFLAGTSVGEVSGTIAGTGDQDYYSFFWAGGAFSATASIANASGGNFTFSEGVVGSCNSLATESLNSSDSYNGTIFLSSLAAGEYCIGIGSSSSPDPNFALTFNTPVSERRSRALSCSSPSASE